MGKLKEAFRNGKETNHNMYLASQGRLRQETGQGILGATEKKAYDTRRHRIAQKVGEVAGAVSSMTRKEKAAILAGGALTIGAGAGILAASNHQRESIRESLSADAEQTIEGFDHIVEGGETPGWAIGAGTKQMVIELKDGSTCVATYGEGKSDKGIFPTEQEIVDPGTCPVVEDDD